MNKIPVVQNHAVQVAHESNLRSQASYDISANAAVHVDAHISAATLQMGTQAAAMAALGSVVQEALGHQTESEVRITAIESNAATTSQLNQVRQSAAASLDAAAYEIQRLAAHAEAQDQRADRVAGQLDIRRFKLYAAPTTAG